VSSCGLRHVATPHLPDGLVVTLLWAGRILKEGRPKATKNALLLPASGHEASAEFGGIDPHPFISRLMFVFAKLREEPPEGQTKEENALIALVENGGNRSWLSQVH
jgi:hypothetical protein